MGESLDEVCEVAGLGSAGLEAGPASIDGLKHRADGVRAIATRDTRRVNESQVTKSNFVDRLLAAVPEIGPVVDEHLADFDGELLLHLLLPELLRFSTAAFGSGDRVTAAKVLTFMSAAFENCDDYVNNAIAVSFVEHVCAFAV
ncbi:MAG: vanillate demethylase subunit [Glaciihabitans sp.]|nr:vanillate demethylase subunit [Glaciihabitans sp.]